VIGTTAGVYLAVCCAARLGYRVLLYPAPRDPAFVAPEGGRVLSLKGEDGALVVAAEFPPPDEKARTVVLFHGNGETIGNGVAFAEALRARGLGVVLAEYRGYGLAGASGPPTEEGLYRDASAVLDELGRQGIGAERVALMGTSLGTGVAAEMARRGRGASLILVSPYTSITEMARRAVPLLPGGWLCPDHYDTLSKASGITVPTLVIHGDEDEVVPFAMGQTVSEAIRGATLHVVKGGHHNDLFAGDRYGLVSLVAETAKR
jgi:fermentation-respiration switch protein FrsA (DUF1100 family)